MPSAGGVRNLTARTNKNAAPSFEGAAFSRGLFSGELIARTRTGSGRSAAAQTKAQQAEADQAQRRRFRNRVSAPAALTRISSGEEAWARERAPVAAEGDVHRAHSDARGAEREVRARQGAAEVFAARAADTGGAGPVEVTGEQAGRIRGEGEVEVRGDAAAGPLSLPVAEQRTRIGGHRPAQETRGQHEQDCFLLENLQHELLQMIFVGRYLQEARQD